MSNDEEGFKLIEVDPKNSENFSSEVMKTERPLRLTWKNINYSFTKDSKITNAVKSVSGFAQPGEILAILGASGSGKTSLISVLSGRLQVPPEVKVSGTVFVNNVDIRCIDYPLLSGYLSQENIYFSYMTAKEALMFTAKLKLDLPEKKIKKRIEKLMEELQVSHVGNTIMGDFVYRGLSGGEKKRVCLACELISAPPVLIMDEPISGLDSYNAEIVLKILKNLANSGRTIVLSVHQPGNKLYSQFDRVILMQNGSFVYQGLRTDLCPYFSEIGIECPVGVNPAEFYVKKFHIVDVNNKTEDEVKTSKLIKRSYRENFDYKSLFLEQYETFKVEQIRCRPGFWFQLWVLTGRGMKGFIRNPLALVFKVANTIVFGSIIMMNYWDLDTDYKDVLNRSGLLRAGMFNSIFFPVFIGTFIIPLERDIMHKEYNDRLYSAEAYILSRILIELPMNIFFAFGMNIMIYFSSDLNTTEPSKFYICMLILFLGQVNGVMIGLIGGGLSDNVRIATFMGTAVCLPLLFFSGYFSNVNDAPNMFQWVKYLSPFYYGYQALLNNEFDGLAVDKNVYPRPHELFDIEHDIGFYIYFFLINTFCSLIIGYIIIKKRADKSTHSKSLLNN